SEGGRGGDRGQRVPAAPRGRGGHWSPVIAAPRRWPRTRSWIMKASLGPRTGCETTTPPLAARALGLVVAVAFTGPAVVVSVMVAAVALRDRVRGLGRCHGRGRGWRRDCGVRRPGMVMMGRPAERDGRGHC